MLSVQFWSRNRRGVSGTGTMVSAHPDSRVWLFLDLVADYGTVQRVKQEERARATWVPVHQVTEARGSSGEDAEFVKRFRAGREARF